MISYVKGLLTGIEEDVIMVGAGSLGLTVHTLVPLLPELSGLGQEVTVYTRFQVREDAMTLCGLLHPQGRDVFQQLLGVNGIGPRDASGILSALRSDDLRLAIVSKDAEVLAEVPGIGTKTTQRVIPDLKDKVSMSDVPGSMTSGTDLGAGSDAVTMVGLAEAAKEAVQVLVALRYTNSEASRAMKQVEIVDGMTSEDALKASLKHLSLL